MRVKSLMNSTTNYQRKSYLSPPPKEHWRNMIQEIFISFQPVRRQCVTDRRQLTNNSLDKVQHLCYQTLKYLTAAPGALATSETSSWWRLEAHNVRTAPWTFDQTEQSDQHTESFSCNTLRKKKEKKTPWEATWTCANRYNRWLGHAHSCHYFTGCPKVVPRDSRPIGFRVIRPVSSHNPSCFSESSPWRLRPPVQLNESAYRQGQIFRFVRGADCKAALSQAKISVFRPKTKAKLKVQA